MASVLIVSKQGDGVPIALRLAQEGHIVKMHIKDEAAKHSLDGYKNPSKVSDPHRLLEQYDLVLSDMVGLGSLCDDFMEKGKLVLGGGTFNDKLELDREYGEKVAKSLMQVKLPTSFLAESPEELVKELSRQDAPKVIKPLGNKVPELTLVSSERGNRTLLTIAMERGRELVPCILENRVEGIEISTEGWFNGTTWVRPFNHTMEKKRFMEGNKGPNVGCMGNVVWTTIGDKLTSSVVEPLAPLLKKVNYVGPIDVNCIISRSDAYFLEFTTRFGYEAIQALTELLKVPLFDYLYKIASKQTDEIESLDEWAIGVRLSYPPYPGHDDAEKLRGVQVVQVEKEARKHVWLADVMKVKDEEVLAGVDGVIGCVTARGQSVRECQRRAYRTIKNVVLSEDIQYRSDIGSDAEEKRKQLVAWGWLNA